MRPLRHATAGLTAAIAVAASLAPAGPALARNHWQWLRECDVTVTGVLGGPQAYGAGGTTLLSITDDYADHYFFAFDQDPVSGFLPGMVGMTLRVPLNLGMPTKIGLTVNSSSFITGSSHSSLTATTAGVYLGYEIGRVCPLAYLAAASYTYLVDSTSLYGATWGDPGAIVNGELIPVGTRASLHGSSSPALGAGIGVRFSVTPRLYLEASLDYWPGARVSYYTTSFDEADYSVGSPARSLTIDPTAVFRIGFGLGPDHIPF